VAARSRALRDVAENTALNTQEFNKAFVLMQYFGYLRRNPYDSPEPTLDYSGFNFWLGKLNSFGGNYINAEMVKAFISSAEYRQRFGREKDRRAKSIVPPLAIAHRVCEVFPKPRRVEPAVPRFKRARVLFALAFLHIVIALD